MMDSYRDSARHCESILRPIYLPQIDRVYRHFDIFFVTWDALIQATANEVISGVWALSIRLSPDRGVYVESHLRPNFLMRHEFRFIWVMYCFGSVS